MKTFERNILTLAGCVICLLCSSFQCGESFEPDPSDSFYQSVSVVNGTEEKIFVHLNERSDSYDYPVPDVGSADKNGFFEIDVDNVIKADVLTKQIYYSDSGEQIYNFNLYILVIKESTKNKYSFDHIVENNIYDYWFCFTPDQIRQLDGKIEIR